MSLGRCIITGGTGAVGPAVARAFFEAGYDVTVASRRAATEEGASGDVARVRLDVSDSSSFGDLFEGADVVVHLASLLHLNHPGADLRADYERVNVEGTRNVLKAARAGGARRVIVASSISVYGYNRGEELGEESETLADSLYGQTKRQAEQVALEYVREDGEKLATILRLSAVYGPGMKGNYMTLLHALSRGRFVPIGPGDNARTLVHVEDVARAILLAAEAPGVAGKIYNVTDGAHHSLHEILVAMCHALGRPAPAWSLPVALVRMGAVPADWALRLMGSPKRVSTLLDKYLEDVRVSGQLFRDEVGFVPQFDLESGWADTVARLREKGDLPSA